MAAELSPIRLAFKALSQLGIAPIALLGLYRLGLLTGHYRRLDSQLLQRARLVASAFHPVFALPESSLLASSISRSARSALTRTANALSEGRFALFGGAPVPLRLTLGTPLQHWTAYETDPKLLNSLTRSGIDIKVLWEPARFGWAYLLGRAFRVGGDEKYARAFWRYFERFDRGNPAYLGPHWMNGQEVAIRLMALLWSAQVFKAASASTQRRRSRLALSIAEHAARIPPTLAYARSQNNNHLVTEATALYLAGVAFDHRAWKDLGWRWLNRAVQRQIGGSGEYIQHSTNYHRLALQSALIADAVRRQRGDLWPSATQQALARASHWLFAIIDTETGAAPNLGANDGALILPLASATFEDYRPTVQAAARAFLRTGLPAGDWDELALWLDLPPSGHTAESSAYAAEHLRGANSWAFLCASTFKSRLGHMDQLHFDLWWRGLNVAADPGTFLYNAPPPWDNPLVSSRVHNCVTIDGREQMTRGGRFMVLDWFPAYIERVLSTEAAVLGQLSGQHQGWNTIGARYRRDIRLMEGDRWQVTDEVRMKRSAQHTIRLHWLLHDAEWRLRRQGREVSLRLRSPRGWIKLGIRITGAVAAPQVTLIRAGRVVDGEGQALPYEGWISRTYAHKVPALSLAVTAVASRKCSMTTEFILPK